MERGTPAREKSMTKAWRQETSWCVYVNYKQLYIPGVISNWVCDMFWGQERAYLFHDTLNKNGKTQATSEEKRMDQ